MITSIGLGPAWVARPGTSAPVSEARQWQTMKRGNGIMEDFRNIFSLEGRTALVVGGGGLGLPIAEALMQNGADVIIADMKARKQERTDCSIAVIVHYG